MAEPARWFQLIHPADRAKVEEAFARAHLGIAVNEEYRIVRADGTERWVRNSVQPSLNMHGVVSRLDGVLADITAHKQAELSLRASEQDLRTVLQTTQASEVFHRSLLDATSCCLWAINSDGNTAYANQAFCQLLGYDQAKLIGTPLHALIADTAFQTTITTVRACLEGTGDQIETDLVSESGELFHMTFSTRCLPTTTDQPKPIILCEAALPAASNRLGLIEKVTKSQRN
jgi:PAS domain S-box-containing protein